MKLVSQSGNFLNENEKENCEKLYELAETETHL